MSTLTYFSVVGAYYASLVDSYDVDTDPDLVPLFGRIRFTPLIDAGDVVKAQTLTPPTNLLLKPIEAQVKAGVVWRNGSEGVKLVANTAVLELDGALYYQVDFPDGLTARGTQYQVDSFPFLAPTTAATVDLSEVTPMPGQPATGPVPTSAVLTVNGRAGYVILGPSDINTAIATDPAATWTALGIAPSGNLPSYVDDVLEFANLAAFPGTGETGKIYVAIDTGDSYRWSGSTYIRISDRITASGITDSTATGRALITAADAAAARATISAVSESTLANVNNSGPNLLIDGSYEQDATWWAQEISPVDTHNTLSTTHARTGSQSMKWTGPTTHYLNVTAAGKSGFDPDYGFVATETGRVYRVSFWVYRDAGNTSAGSVRAIINLKGVGGNDIVNGAAVVQSALTLGDWTHYSSTFTVPATGTHAPYSGVAPAISMLTIDNADQLWVDNVRFDDLTDAPIELLAPPPTGDQTTDTANVQALVDLIQTIGGGTIVLRAGTYAMDIVTARVLRQPVFIGQGEQVTLWDGTLRMLGVPPGGSQYSGGWLSDLSFTGSHAGQAAVEFNGVCDVHWDRVRVQGTYDRGILFHNELSGHFTELCNGRMHFGTGVTTAVEYRVGAGGASFHQSGLLVGSAIQQSTSGPPILIGTNARPYNAPLSVGVWTEAVTTYPVIQHNGQATSNFFGNLTVEQNATAAPLAAGNTIYYVGGISGWAGSASLPLNKGTLTQLVSGVQAVSGGSLTPLPLTLMQGGELDLYNTADQITNYERAYLRWIANVLTIGVENGGTGTRRTLTVANHGKIIMSPTAVGPTTGTIQLFDSTNTPNACIAAVTGTGGASSGTQYGLAVTPTYTQSATAGYIALLINPTETATGSGAKKLIDAQVGGTPKFTVDNTGKVTTTGGVVPRVTTAASASTLTPDADANDAYHYTALAANLAINAPAGTPSSGQLMDFRITDDGTSRTLTLDAIFRALGVVIPAATTASKTLLIRARYNATATKWDVYHVALEGGNGVVVGTGNTVALHNTTDQVTNYERGRLYWTGNVLTIGVENGGTGTRRNLSLANHGQLIMQASVQGPALGTISLFDSTGTPGTCIAAVTGTGSAASGTQYGLSVSPTYNQSGTASYVALLVNATETATGSGSKLLADFQVGGSSKAKIDNTGTITLTDAANLALATTTGTKIGTGTTQKLGFWNTTPVVQPAAVADATDAATVITQLNALLSRLRTIGLIAP